MQIVRIATLVLASTAALPAAADAAQVTPVQPAVFQPRHANIVVDARERSIAEALERQKYRGPRPLVTVGQPLAVGRAQIAALGFPHVSPTASGVLIQVDVSDSTGRYRDLYVYDPQTHFIRYQIENVILPGAHTSSIKRAEPHK